MQIEVNDVQRKLPRNALAAYRQALDQKVNPTIGSAQIILLLQAQAEIRTIEDQLESEEAMEGVSTSQFWKIIELMKAEPDSHATKQFIDKLAAILKGNDESIHSDSDSHQ
jgi:hypothetical protein